MARKIQRSRTTRNFAAIAALRLRQEMGLPCVMGPGLRARKIALQRVQVPVTVIIEPARPVKMVHVAQNLGSALSEILPAQNQRA